MYGVTGENLELGLKTAENIMWNLIINDGVEKDSKEVIYFIQN